MFQILILNGMKNVFKSRSLPGIYKYFEDYGVEYFKDLDIWHIPQLRDKLNEKN